MWPGNCDLRGWRGGDPSCAYGGRLFGSFVLGGYQVEACGVAAASGCVQGLNLPAVDFHVWGEYHLVVGRKTFLRASMREMAAVRSVRALPIV